MSKLKTEKWEKRLRLMLNDFFMDVDNEAEIPTETANAIVEVHLQKFKNTISTLLKEQKEEYLNKIHSGEDGK